jgi:hypothetical protein
MYTDSIFDELGLVEKLETTSRTSHKNTKKQQQYMDAKYVTD